MTLKVRFFILFALMLAAMAGGMLVLQGLHKLEEADAVAGAKQDNARLLERVLPLMEYPIQQFAQDYSMWDEMVAFLKTHDPEWARINLDASLATFKLDAIWVITLQGTIHYSVSTNPAQGTPDLTKLLAKLVPLMQQQPIQHFYFRDNNRIYALHTAPIQPSADIDRTTPALGWLIGARELDANFLRTLGDLNNAKVTIQDHAAEPLTTGKTADTTLNRSLHGLEGEPIASLQLVYDPLILAEEFNQHETFLMLGVTGLLIGLTMVCLYLWVLRPFRVITNSLDTNDPTVLHPLLGSTAEMDHVARLIHSHFLHQRALSQTLKDRAHIARDLHDGVIQSIYAAGMGISVAQSLLKSDPGAADEKLLQIRSALNDTIRETRAFIAGLGDDDAQNQSFGETIKSLLETMQSIRRVETICSIDEEAAALLTTSAKAQILQMIREAVSNSLRHSQAHAISVTLGRTTDTISIEITDNGEGFDPAGKKGTGRGLKNLTERAKSMGASAEIHAQPGKGTRVEINLPVKQTP